MAWSCQVCTFINLNASFLACGACGAERGAERLVLKRPTRPPPSLPSLQQASSTTAAVLPPAPSVKTQEQIVDEKIRPVYEELVETEKTYVDELEVIVTEYVRPLRYHTARRDPNHLSEADISLIFSNVEELHRVNQILYKQLEQAMKVDSPVERVRILCTDFASIVPHLKLYSTYAVNFDKASLTLKRCEEENFRFAEFLKMTSLLPKMQSSPLEAFLIKPIQRICKYPLFFQTMLKLVDPKDKVYPALKTGLEAAQSVAEAVNSEKARAEASSRMHDISTRMEGLGDVILEPDRHYIGEWRCMFSVGNNSLAKKRRSMVNLMAGNDAEKKPRACLLFNDVLIVAKEVGNPGSVKLRYELRVWMSLDQLNVTEINPNDPRLALANHASAASSASAPQAENDNGMSKYREAFKLPLDLVHVASSDLQRNKELRDRQQAHLSGIVSRRPSFIKLKKQNSGSGAETVITSYTMWFRSAAERGRVHALLSKTAQAKAHPSTLSPIFRRSVSDNEPLKSRGILRTTSTGSLGNGPTAPQSPIFTGPRSASTDDFGTQFAGLLLDPEPSQMSIKELKTAALKLGVNPQGLEKPELVEIVSRAQRKHTPLDAAHSEEDLPMQLPVLKQPQQPQGQVQPKPRKSRPRPPPPPPPPPPPSASAGLSSASLLAKPSPFTVDGGGLPPMSPTRLDKAGGRDLVQKWFGDD